MIGMSSRRSTLPKIIQHATCRTPSFSLSPSEVVGIPQPQEIPTRSAISEAVQLCATPVESATPGSAQPAICPSESENPSQSDETPAEAHEPTQPTTAHSDARRFETLEASAPSSTPHESGGRREEATSSSSQNVLPSADQFPVLDDESDPITRSNIWMSIVSQMEGVRVYDEVFHVSDLHENKIVFDPNVNASWLSIYTPGTGTGRIQGSNKYHYETTVENIQSSIVVHEYYSHIKKNNGDNYKSHRLTYKNVINYKPLWIASSVRTSFRTIQYF